MREKIADKILKKAVDEGRIYFHTHRVLEDGHDKMVLNSTWERYKDPSNVTQDDLLLLAKHASEIVDKDLMDYNTLSAKHSAVELTIKTLGNGKYDGKINGDNFYKIVNLMNLKTGGKMEKTAKYFTDRLDKVADHIRKLVRANMISPKNGFAMEMALDQISDDLETHFAKSAKADESDTEETYVREAYNDPATIERDADELYMKDWTNGGQNVMSEGMQDGKFKLPVDEEYKAKAAAAKAAPAKEQPKLDAKKLAEKRQK